MQPWLASETRSACVASCACALVAVQGCEGDEASRRWQRGNSGSAPAKIRAFLSFRSSSTCLSCKNSFPQRVWQLLSVGEKADSSVTPLSGRPSHPCPQLHGKDTMRDVECILGCATDHDRQQGDTEKMLGDRTGTREDAVSTRACPLRGDRLRRKPPLLGWREPQNHAQNLYEMALMQRIRFSHDRERRRTKGGRTHPHLRLLEELEDHVPQVLVRECLLRVPVRPCGGGKASAATTGGACIGSRRARDRSSRERRGERRSADGAHRCNRVARRTRSGKTCRRRRRL